VEVALAALLVGLAALAIEMEFPLGRRRHLVQHIARDHSLRYSSLRARRTRPPSLA